MNLLFADSHSARTKIALLSYWPIIGKRYSPRSTVHCFSRCNGGVNTALQFDKQGSLRFAALQSNAGKTLLKRSGRAPDDISSIVLVEENESYIKSEAILRIAQYLQIPFPILGQIGLPLPLFIRDSLYDSVSTSSNRTCGLHSNRANLVDHRRCAH